MPTIKTTKYKTNQLVALTLAVMLFAVVVSLLSASASVPGAVQERPNPPVITEPNRDGQLVSAADVHMETAPFSSPVPGDTHAATEWEIRLVSSDERIWSSRVTGGKQLIHTHLADGKFEGSHAGRRDLLPNTNYRLRARHEGSIGGPSDWSARSFRTTSQIPGDPDNRWRLHRPGFRVDVVATDFQLPVNIAFVPNPGKGEEAPVFYVTELYGTIKVVLRDGHVRNYATGLLNFNPTGAFPGSGEQGVAGIAVDPATGDVYASLVYSIRGDQSPNNHYGRVVRFQSDDGGLTAARQDVIFDTACVLPENWTPGLTCGEEQGQSHQISNVTIRTDEDGVRRLYVHNGEGFFAARARNLNSFGGKILRMNLDGSPVEDNPFYDGSIHPPTGRPAARNFVYTLGYRNPFGGDWRAADGKHYVVENGPDVNDRLSQVVPGRDYLWDGTSASMRNFAIYNWSPNAAPVNAAFIQPETFGGSDFPKEMMGHLFVSESGPTYGLGPQANGKRVTEFVLDENGDLVSGPTRLIEYIGTGRASVVALAAGPDGLYFSDLYREDGVGGPTARGANIYRIKRCPPGQCPLLPFPPVLRVTDVCVGGIDLAWTSTAGQDGRYEVERSTDGLNFTRIATVGADVTRYSDRGLKLGTYHYRVRAFNSENGAILSNIVRATIGPVNVDHSTGFGENNDLNSNGSARFDTNIARLTDGGTGQAGTFFSKDRVGIRGFTTTFTFQVRPGTNPMADGFTFIIQGNSATALGPSGGGLGYGPDAPGAGRGIRNSVAVKFDFFSNSGEGDNSTGLFTDGRSPTVPETGSGDVLVNLNGTGIDLKNQNEKQVVLTYDGTTLSQTITDLVTKASFSTSYKVDIASFTGDTAFVGFGGGTGGLTAIQEIRTWTFNEQEGDLPPRAPSNMQVTNVRRFDETRSNITVAWRCNNAYTATGFVVERSTDGTTFTEIATVDINTTSYTDQMLTGGTYYYRARSSDAQKRRSRPSNTDSVRIGGGDNPTIVDHSAGFESNSDLTRNGSTTYVGTFARLTSGANAQAGTFFTSNKVGIANFTTSFEFQIRPGTNPMADGFTFIIQGNSPTALGPAGGGLAYGSDQPGGGLGITNSIAVKFDIFSNAGEGNNSTGLFADGRSPTVPQPDSGDVLVNLDGTGIVLTSQRLFKVDMTYDGTTLSVTITDIATKASTTNTYTVDIASKVGGNVAHIGFGGGTGGLTAIQDIRTWTYTSQKAQ